MKRLRPLLLLLPLTGCLQKPPHPAIRYTVGAPYQADGIWRYPRAEFSYDATGIAAVYSGRHARFTADGERYSPEAFAAAHPTLQLPAIARITNLENGRQIVLRINDRGPADPARILAVTPRVASLLGFSPGGTARVRVQVLPGPSQALALSLPGGPTLAVSLAPIRRVAVSALPPLPGAYSAEGPAHSARPSPEAAQTAPPPGPAPGTLSEVAPAPDELWVRTGLFTSQRYAALQAASLGRFGAAMAPRYGSGALQVEVRVGPFATIPEADAMLKKVLRAGVPGARLVAE